jgi:hypothetical protein
MFQASRPTYSSGSAGEQPVRPTISGLPPQVWYQAEARRRSHGAFVLSKLLWQRRFWMWCQMSLPEDNMNLS